MERPQVQGNMGRQPVSRRIRQLLFQLPRLILRAAAAVVRGLAQIQDQQGIAVLAALATVAGHIVASLVEGRLRIPLAIQPKRLAAVDCARVHRMTTLSAESCRTMLRYCVTAFHTMGSWMHNSTMNTSALLMISIHMCHPYKWWLQEEIRQGAAKA